MARFMLMLAAASSGGTEILKKEEKKKEKKCRLPGRTDHRQAQQGDRHQNPHRRLLVSYLFPLIISKTSSEEILLRYKFQQQIHDICCVYATIPAAKYDTGRKGTKNRDGVTRPSQ